MTETKTIQTRIDELEQTKWELLCAYDYLTTEVKLRLGKINRELRELYAELRGN